MEGIQAMDLSMKRLTLIPNNILSNLDGAALLLISVIYCSTNAEFYFVHTVDNTVYDFFVKWLIFV